MSTRGYEGTLGTAFVKAAVDYQRCTEEMRKTTDLVQSTGSLYQVANVIRHFSHRFAWRQEAQLTALLQFAVSRVHAL
jgi:iron-sulfur cluster repair protein YtfE (RIC family)